ncbi:MAG: Wzz/FepE/Etk N-terminal domain-containing protein, partial [Victivallaceae bacterium]
MKELNFWFFWEIFKRCWKIMLISALLFGVGSYCVSKFLIKPVYQAKVSLYLGNVKSSDEQSSGAKQGTAELIQTLNIGIQLANDFRELLNSTRIQQFVANRMVDIPAYSTTKFTVSANLIKQSRLIDIT